MKIIAHRGLMNGPDKSIENSPAQIEMALAAGFDVEIDVWFLMVKDDRPGLRNPGDLGTHMRGSWWLGHDDPQYETTESFLTRPGLWLHCKNLDALNRMSPDMHHFWHENDPYTLTSRGVVWCHPKQFMPNRRESVAVLPEWSIDPEHDMGEALLSYYDSEYQVHICTDYGSVMMVAQERLRKEYKTMMGIGAMNK